MSQANRSNRRIHRFILCNSFSNRFWNLRSISNQHIQSGHCKSDNPVPTSDTYCRQPRSQPQSYGYKKCDDDKHKIEIDTYAANVVKDIFRMKLQGMSQDAIACRLNENGILCPADYKKSEGSNYQTSFKIKDKSGWSSTTVRRILTNEIYIGNLVQGKHTTPNRPEFNRMIEDIKSGKINTIITKDLSRLGRNYIESGTYIERIFPMYNVRYIAITDDFDSIRPNTDITMPLKNIVNEYYSKDLSDKVWTAFRSIWKNGLYVCGRPPYGYKKNKEKKCLEIDEYASQVVKRIFSMYLNGMKFAEIARTLKNEGILSPSQYRYANIGDKEKFDKAKDWYYVQVKDILKDQQYVGDSVHGKLGGKLGEHRNKRRNDKEDWIIIPDTHEAIVSREEFAIVQKMIGDSTKQFNDAINRGKQKAPVPKNKFVGKCTCGQCGSRVFIKRKDTGKSEFYYYCAGEKSSVLCRDRHVKIPYEDLDRSVFSVIKNICS